MNVLDESTFQEGLAFLTAVDPDLDRSVQACGTPPLRQRGAGFPSLVQIILEQQVSVASARATYDRLVATIGLPTPESFLAQEDTTLRDLGFSRQKARYCRELAGAICEKRLDLAQLTQADDESVRAALTALPGIGAWTAEIYLLVALRRPDAWPVGDLGVIVGAQRVKRLSTRPDRETLMQMALPWRPWRSVATFILWNSYLQP